MCFNERHFLGFHEDVDRRVSQNSLGDVTKLGSKTALNRRVRNGQLEIFLHIIYTRKLLLCILANGCLGHVFWVHIHRLASDVVEFFELSGFVDPGLGPQIAARKWCLARSDQPC